MQFQPFRSFEGLFFGSIAIASTCGQARENDDGEYVPELSHFSYIRDAQMKGPTPLGSFSVIFSWM